MKEISSKEAAQRWGITPRRVQLYCAEGRISGAKRVGHMWLIPSEVEKPKDPRFFPVEAKNLYWPEFFLIDSSLMRMQSVEQMLGSVASPLREEQLRGEIAYMQGNFQRAANCLDGLTDESPGYLTALVISTTAKVALGNIQIFQESWDKLKQLHERYINSIEICHMIEVVQGLLAISAYAPQHCPSWILEGVIENLPEPYRLMALYLRAKSLLALGQIKQLVSTTEAVLSLNPSNCGIQGVYLYIILSHGYIYLGKLDKAYDTLLHALNICLPKGFISPLAESVSSLLGMGERCLRKAYPHLLSSVLSLHRKISPSWVQIHNMLTHENITNMLTRREYQVALAVVGGLSNQECAKRLEISVSTIKGHLLSIYQKLNITSRKALKAFIISA